MTEKVHEYRDGDCCDLIDTTKRIYTHHLSVAVTEALKLSALKHVTLDKLYWVWRHDFCNGSNVGWYGGYLNLGPPRAFVSVGDVIQAIAQRHGLYCRACDRIIFTDDDDFHHSSYSGTTLRRHWRCGGICGACLKDSKISQLFLQGEKEYDSAVDAYVLSRRIGFDYEVMMQFFGYLSAAGPTMTAEHFGVSVSSVRRIMHHMKKLKMEYVPAVKKTHKKWKVAYDAMRELGIVNQ